MEMWPSYEMDAVVRGEHQEQPRRRGRRRGGAGISVKCAGGLTLQIYLICEKRIPRLQAVPPRSRPGCDCGLWRESWLTRQQPQPPHPLESDGRGTTVPRAGRLARYTVTASSNTSLFGHLDPPIERAEDGRSLVPPSCSCEHTQTCTMPRTHHQVDAARRRGPMRIPRVVCALCRPVQVCAPASAGKLHRVTVRAFLRASHAAYA